MKGPRELTEKKLDNAKHAAAADDSDFDLDTADEEDADDADDTVGSRQPDDNAEEGDDYNMEKLRQYQLNRLKYYYAVIVCNSVAAADKIYSECDGMEYESTATKMDLRFVPDEMTFDDTPKDVCTEMPDTSKYMPRLFTTTALQQAKVELTWDENDLERKELNDKLAAGKLGEVADQELRKYVAYSSEEEEEEEDVPQNNVKHEPKKSESVEQPAGKKSSISKYKALLTEINERESEKKNNRIEMEFSWGIGMKDKPSTAAAADDSDQSSDEDNDADGKKPVANKSKSADPEKTHFDRIVELKKEKKKARKQEQKLKRKKYRNGGNLNDSESDSEIGGNLDSDDDGDIPDGIDLNDPYFAEEFAGGDFEAAKATKKRGASKKKRNRHDDDEVDSEAEREKAKLALLLDGDTGDRRAHFNLKQIQDGENEKKTQRKRKKVLRRSKKQNEAEKAMLQADDFQIDTTDDRFKAIYTSHLFNIDPTNPNFKKTKAMDALIGEKLKRVPAGQMTTAAVDGPALKKTKRNVEMSMLVKSIKRKVAQQ